MLKTAWEVTNHYFREVSFPPLLRVRFDAANLIKRLGAISLALKCWRLEVLEFSPLHPLNCYHGYWTCQKVLEIPSNLWKQHLKDEEAFCWFGFRKLRVPVWTYLLVLFEQVVSFFWTCFLAYKIKVIISYLCHIVIIAGQIRVSLFAFF